MVDMVTFLWRNYDRYNFCSSYAHFPRMMWKEIFLPIPQMQKLKFGWLVNSVKCRSYDGNDFLKFNSQKKPMSTVCQSSHLDSICPYPSDGTTTVLGIYSSL